ncbi:hypothetical protein EON81_07560 [bacterium]|nr:MAG: hypothetical protein EON81_07560 [bacterium]
MPVALLAAFAISAPTFRLETTKNGNVDLVHAGKRLPVQPYRKTAVARWSGTILTGTGSQLIYDAKGKVQTFDLAKELETWLEDDDLWGGRANANNQRYTAMRGGGFVEEVTDLLPQTDGSALGVLTLRVGFMSGEPFGPQLLFRFRPKGNHLEPLRVFSGYGGPENGRSPSRIFRAGQRQWIQDVDLYELTPIGALGKRVAKLPQYTVSLALSAQRWIVTQTWSRANGGRSYDAIDTRTGKITPLHRPSPGNGEGTSMMDASEEAPYILLLTESGEQRSIQTVRIPDGKRTKIDGRAGFLWGDYAIGITDKVEVWSAANGKPLASLAWPAK